MGATGTSDEAADRERAEALLRRVTVGIVTALPKEFVAARAMLDWPVEYSAPGKGGGRSYVLGEIPAKGGGTHAVVLVQARMGNNFSAARVTAMLGRFEGIDAVLMVGIAGGVPNPQKAEDHVRLGDIVVSSQGGVVQYDFDKETARSIEHRYPPRPPSSRLLDAVDDLIGAEHEGRYPWLDHIPRAARLKGSRRPPQNTDRLTHPSRSRTVLKHPRDPDRIKGQPRVFHGPIASANKLLKNPKKRDKLRDQFGVKAVEMEASGIADATWDREVGYLVVRSICDYCDRNKTNTWQQYAAIVAAAYARAVLERMDPSAPRPTSSTGAEPDPAPPLPRTAARARSRGDARSAEIINYGAQRSDPVHFFGREDVLATIDRHLGAVDARSGWMLITGSPGMGKSALLSRWICLQEQHGHKVPHHFLRRDVMDSDRPEEVVRSLSAQVEELYPAQKDPHASPERRLYDLLARVSQQELGPRRERLVLVLDGLDEAQSKGAGQNPLPRFLPHELPPGVQVLCALRPQYPHLPWLEAHGDVRRIDLDAPAWAGSNAEACRGFWAHHAPLFDPPLEESFVAEAVARSQGNLLYGVMLREWLQDQPPEKRRAEILPRGLAGFLEQIWRQFKDYRTKRFNLVTTGLGLICAAREALPLDEIEAAAGWSDIRTKDEFLDAARALLLEEPAHWRGAPSYRPYHEAFREFVATKLTPRLMSQMHQRLLDTTARWPISKNDNDFRKRYTLHYAVVHALAAGNQEKARELCQDLRFLEARCWEDGPGALEVVLRDSAKECDDEDLDLIYRAVMAESHWLRAEPRALSGLMYNRLRSVGWGPERIASSLRFPGGRPMLRLRQPVRMWNGEERSLFGHEGGVIGCAASPDGRRFVSASYDRTLKVWDVTTGQVLSTLQGHSDWVMACAISPDSRLIASASYDRSLKIWDLNTGELLSTLLGHSDAVKACTISPDGQHIVSASFDRTLRLWDLHTGRLLSTLDGHSGAVTACAISPDGERIISASEDRTIKIWDTATGQLLSTLEGHSAAVTACAVNPVGGRIISASEDRTVKIWDTATGQLLSTLEGHSGAVTACAVSPDGERIISASDDKTIKIWDAATGQLLSTLEAHSNKVTACVVSPNGPRIVSASEDSAIKVWNLGTVQPLATAEGHLDIVSACVISSDERRIVSASDDGTLRVWDLATGQLLLTLDGRAGLIRACAVSPDGQRVIAASNEGTLKVWDLATGQFISTLQGHSDAVTACAVSPDGGRIISASDDKTLKVWNLAEGQLLLTLQGHSDAVTACAVSPDGAQIVSASDDRTLRVWSLATGSFLSSLEGHEGLIRACAISPDGQHIVSASDDKTLKVWDLNSGRLHSTLQGHSDAVTACAISPDGQLIVSASDDKTLKVWELNARRLLSTLEGHEGMVRACAISPDGRHIISASNDRTLKIWDLATAVCLDTAYGVSSFGCVAALNEFVCGGDRKGNLWLLDLISPEPVRADPSRFEPSITR